MAAVVQIVDRVGAAGTVLMNLNHLAAGAALGARDEVALADVESARSDAPWAWSPTAHAGGPVELRSRQITIPLVLMAATPDSAAALVRQVNGLVRGRFVLKLQRHGSTVPVWLRCAPCVPRWNTQIAGAGQPTRIVTGTLVAETEPYALGARVDVGPVTITQDPATGTPFVWDITGVGGDSPTPLVLRTDDAEIVGEVDRILISVRQRGTPTSLTGLVVQAEDGTTATGTAPPTLSTLSGDSGLSDGGGVRATYGTGASGPWSVAASFSSLSGTEAPGLYRLLARVRRAGGAAGALFSLIATVGRQRLVEPFTADGNDTRVIDLGLVQVPIGQPPMMSAPETPTRATGPDITLTVVRAEEGTGTLDVDWLGLFPADEGAGVLEVASAGSGWLVLDGYDHVPRMFTADPYLGSNPSAVGAPDLSFLGGAPRLRPGTNRLYVVAGLGIDAASSRAPGLSFDLSGSYWPRHGWLG